MIFQCLCLSESWPECWVNSFQWFVDRIDVKLNMWSPLISIVAYLLRFETQTGDHLSLPSLPVAKWSHLSFTSLNWSQCSKPEEMTRISIVSSILHKSNNSMRIVIKIYVLQRSDLITDYLKMLQMVSRLECMRSWESVEGQIRRSLVFPRLRHILSDQ